MDIKQKYEARTYLLDPDNINLISFLSKEWNTDTTLTLDIILDEFRDFTCSDDMKLEVSKSKLEALKSKIDTVDKKLEAMIQKLNNVRL